MKDLHARTTPKKKKNKKQKKAEPTVKILNKGQSEPAPSTRMDGKLLRNSFLLSSQFPN